LNYIAIKDGTHTRLGLNLLLRFEDCRANEKNGEEMAAQVNKKPELETENSHLSKQDTRLLLVMCTKLVNLCAKLTGRIDPAAHFDLSIRYVGHAEQWDDMIVEGDLSRRNAIVRIRGEGRDLAVATVGRDDEYLRAELAGRCHVWMAPADQGLFWRCAGRGCGHVFGLSRGE
jgi:hypothetical protein